MEPLKKLVTFFSDRLKKYPQNIILENKPFAAFRWLFLWILTPCFGVFSMFFSSSGKQKSFCCMELQDFCKRPL